MPITLLFMACVARNPVIADAPASGPQEVVALQMRDRTLRIWADGTYTVIGPAGDVQIDHATLDAIAASDPALADEIRTMQAGLSAGE